MGLKNNYDFKILRASNENKLEEVIKQYVEIGYRVVSGSYSGYGHTFCVFLERGTNQWE